MDVLTNSYLNFNSLTNSTEDFFSRPSECEAQALLEKLQNNNSFNDVNLDNFLKSEKDTGETVETVETSGVVAATATPSNAFQTSYQQPFAIVPVGEKNDMITKEQLCAMIDSGNQLNMNAVVSLNFMHEGKPFGLKLSIFLQLLLHQAAYAYWMGKKSAPTASRNCKFEGAAKGQTKYPKRKFCGWVNKVAEISKSNHDNEDLCTALQELWSLLRLSPAEMDCKQNDNIKRIILEFFRVHTMLINSNSQPISQVWTNVLTSAAHPEVFMKRDNTKVKKSKAKSPSPAPQEFASPAKKLKTMPITQPAAPATQQQQQMYYNPYPNPTPMSLYTSVPMSREIPLGILPLPTTPTGAINVGHKRPLDQMQINL